METLKYQNYNLVLDNGTSNDEYILYFISSGFFMFYYGITKKKDLKAVLKNYYYRYETGHEQRINALFNRYEETKEGEPVILYIDTVQSREEAKYYIKEYIKGNPYAINDKTLNKDQTKPKTTNKKKATPKK